MDIDLKTMLTVVLGLVAVWIVVEILSELMGWIGWLLGPLRPVIGLLVLVAIALFVYDRFL
ncbi:DUF7554 family protein [Halococcoides cellulosivorans]|uniref:Uncharacterized protein n=1 Tax=Halococcoides cellulosivorans TaxID=1679096 RepID=A0A2R4X042_9EURY|nr:hypothetical protein [Halococcoides cellulosivorans]AWB27157.1 hypothetical protein HARCEL1_05275 [Halococcoides cellulosivorans]